MPILSSWRLAGASQRYVMPAFARTMLAADARSRGCYPEAMGFYEAALGHVMQRSAAEHEDHLLLYCVKGRGLLTTAGVSQPLQAGSLAVLPAGQPHRYEADPEAPWSLYWVHAQGDTLPALLQPLLLDEPLKVWELGVVPALQADWRSLLEAASPGFEPATLQLAAARLRQLLVHTAWWLGRRQSRRHRLDVNALQAFMRQHLDQPLTLEQLAAHAGLEKFHFAKTFRRLTGQAPLQHFQHLRMARACEWLDTDTAGISEIAARLGYDDPAYFSRQFRQVIGLSPSAYRGLKRG